MKRVSVLMATLLVGCASAPETAPPPPSPASDPAPARRPLTPEEREAFFRGGRPKPTVDEAEVAKHPLGSLQNPIRVNGPAGEHAYLARLRCEDGGRPDFQRTGSVGTRSPWGYILDAYSLTCASGQKAAIYMDMYHREHQEDRPVPGFSLDPRAPG
jgi:hypothetical protein